jgi:hypothetical protein
MENLELKRYTPRPVHVPYTSPLRSALGVYRPEGVAEQPKSGKFGVY